MKCLWEKADQDEFWIFFHIHSPYKTTALQSRHHTWNYLFSKIWLCNMKLEAILLTHFSNLQSWDILTLRPLRWILSNPMTLPDSYSKKTKQQIVKKSEISQWQDHDIQSQNIGLEKTSKYQQNKGIPSIHLKMFTNYLKVMITNFKTYE